MEFNTCFIKKFWTDFLYKKQEDTFAGQDTEQKNRTYSQEKRLFDDLEQWMSAKRPYLRHDLSRRDLTSELRTNECYLTNAIRKCANKTINEYINSYRLEHAAQLLLASGEEVTIESVAYDSGFSSQRHFYRLFQSRYKQTPARYRKMHEDEEGLLGREGVFA